MARQAARHTEIGAVRHAADKACRDQHAYSIGHRGQKVAESEQAPDGPPLLNSHWNMATAP